MSFGHFSSQISNSIETKNYMNLWIPMVTIIIDNLLIRNSLIDLGIAINVMKMDTMQSLNLHNLRPTPTIIELVLDQESNRNV